MAMINSSPQRLPQKSPPGELLILLEYYEHQILQLLKSTPKNSWESCHLMYYHKYSGGNGQRAAIPDVAQQQQQQQQQTQLWRLVLYEFWSFHGQMKLFFKRLRPVSYEGACN